VTTVTSPKLFGTDGVRGVAGRPPLDAATLVRLGAAIISAHPLGRPARLVIGRDTRESGPWIERELARGAASQGAGVTSVGVLPTPGVAYLAGALDFDLGVVISASHNSFEDNGIKVFSGRGEKFGEAEERAVEAVMADAVQPAPNGIAPPLLPAPIADAYLAHLVRLLPAAGPLAGTRLAVDMANGATTTTARRVLSGLGFDVVPIGDAPDGRNINLACGSTHPARLIETVVSKQCRFGVAFDGDGDRAIFADHRGRLIDGDAVLLLLAAARHRRGGLPGGVVVATVMSNLGLEIALAERGIRLVRTPVGDKYVMEEMLRHGYTLGGEQSGHVILAEHLFTGDGLATALAVLQVMAETGADLADLAADLVPCPQTLVNVRVRDRRPISSVPEVAAAMARVEAAQAGRGRLLVRYSGTEPLLRVMVEGEDQATVQAWAEEVAQAVRDTLG
jgi:phosphoglucosamine mutase